MKRINLLFVAVLAIVFSFSTNSFAQDKPQGHFYTVTTWKFTIPEDGSRSELDSLMTVWHDMVIVKNDKVVSEKVLRHYWGHDMRDWVFVTEYASWADIEAAGDMQGKLVEAAWPDKMDRKKFFSAFNKYAVTHSDEIFQELPDLAK